MSALLTSAYPLLQFELDKFLLEFEQQHGEVSSGVSVEGPAAAYALVWEWGNARQVRVGPKTTVGTNPDGKKVFLSIQAPRGYIRVNSPLYWAALEQEMQKVKFAGTSTGAIHDELEAAAERIATRVRDIIREHAPVDTGQLHDEIQVVSVGDILLDESDEQGALLIGEE
jgi:hypothetical protein